MMNNPDGASSWHHNFRCLVFDLIFFANPFSLQLALVCAKNTVFCFWLKKWIFRLHLLVI
jgi:hypothetical protein